MAKERKKKKATKKASKKKTTKKKAPKKTTKRKSTKKKTTRKKTAKKRTTKKKTTKRKTTKRKASKKKETTPPGILEADQAIAFVDEPPSAKMSPGKIVAFAGAGVLLAGGMYMLVRLMTNGSGGTTAGPTMTSPMAVNGFGYYPNYYNY